MELIGHLLAQRFRIDAELGGGAMGVVYRAKDLALDREVALKVLRPELLHNEMLVERFEQEARVACRLRHRNLISVLDTGVADGFRYTVMELATGVSLRELMGTPMPRGRVIHLVRQLLEGLQSAHDAGLIHRDFKPDNVIVDRDANGKDVPRIVDFGIAILREHAASHEARGRLTTMGVVLGTPEYMAPEQACSSAMDHRVDLFAVGVVCYALLAGKMPFDGSCLEVVVANVSEDPLPISLRAPGVQVDPLLDAFARKLMRRDPEERPATAAAACELLDLIALDRPAGATELGVDDQEGTCPLPKVGRAERFVAPLALPPAPQLATAAPMPRVLGQPIPGHGRRLAVLLACCATTIALVAGVWTDTRPAAAAPVVSAEISATVDSVDIVHVALTASETAGPPPDARPIDLTSRPRHGGSHRTVATTVAVTPPSSAPGRIDPIASSATSDHTAPATMQADLPAANDETSAGVARLYAAVGLELAALPRTIEAEGTRQLWDTYRRLRIQELLASPVGRAHAHRTLSALREAIRARPL